MPKKPQDLTKNEKLAFIRRRNKLLDELFSAIIAEHPEMALTQRPKLPDNSVILTTDNQKNIKAVLEEFQVLDAAVSLTTIHQWDDDLTGYGTLSRNFWERFRLLILTAGCGIGMLTAGRAIAEGLFLLFVMAGLATPANIIPIGFLYAGYALSFAAGIIVGVVTHFLIIEKIKAWYENKENKQADEYVKKEEKKIKEKQLEEKKAEDKLDNNQNFGIVLDIKKAIEILTISNGVLTTRINRFLKEMCVHLGLNYEDILTQTPKSTFVQFFASEDNPQHFIAKLKLADQLYEHIFTQPQFKPRHNHAAPQPKPALNSKPRNNQNLTTASIPNVTMSSITSKSYCEAIVNLKKCFETFFQTMSTSSPSELSKMVSEIEPFLKTIVAFNQEKAETSPSFSLENVVLSNLHSVLVEEQGKLESKAELV